jgi:hypothetical protein
MTKKSVSQTSILQNPRFLVARELAPAGGRSTPEHFSWIGQGCRFTTAAQPSGSKLTCHKGFGRSWNVFQSIAQAMRQLVTRQTTTPFFVVNGTTLLTLLDPDQDPPGPCSGGPMARLPALRWLLKKNESEFAALHIRGGSRCRGHKPRRRYYLTEEDLCSV